MTAHREAGRRHDGAFEVGKGAGPEPAVAERALPAVAPDSNRAREARAARERGEDAHDAREIVDRLTAAPPPPLPPPPGAEDEPPPTRRPPPDDDEEAAAPHAVARPALAARRLPSLPAPPRF